MSLKSFKSGQIHVQIIINHLKDSFAKVDFGITFLKVSKLIFFKIRLKASFMEQFAFSAKFIKMYKWEIFHLLKNENRHLELSKRLLNMKIRAVLVPQLNRTN